MKSAFWRVIALASIAVLVPSMVFAGGEVARSSMAGTNFMNTSADTWVLFHRSMDGEGFGEFVSQGYAGAFNKGTPIDNQGYGRLILPVGDYRLGFEVNDHATGSSVADYMANGGAYRRSDFIIGDFVGNEGATGNNAFGFGQMVNAKLAFGAGEGAASVGAGIYNHTDEDKEGGFKDGSTGFTVNGSWGNGAPGVSGTVEIAAEFTSNSDKFEDSNDSANDEELSGTGFAADGRYSISDDSHLSAGAMVASHNYDTDGASDKYKLMVMKAAYIRDLIEEDSRGACVEFGLGWVSDSFEPDGASEQKSKDIMIPSCRFSGWNQITQKFRLYGGVESSWSTGTYEDVDNNDDDSFTGDSFDWSAGLGWNPNDNVMIEFFLLTSNISNFLTLGSTTPVVGGIGAHASW
jgi:hypothetical protein